MKFVKINEEFDTEIYVVYDEKHRYIECISIHTPVDEYLKSNPIAKFVEKVHIYDEYEI